MPPCNGGRIPVSEFYVDGQYNDYLYHQNYRFLNATDSRYAQNLTLTGFTIDEALANRNANGGTNDLLSASITGGTFLGSTFTTTGGDEHRRYKTYIIAGGMKWQATDALDVNIDLSYVKADQTQDNRSVTLAAAAGLGWDITRKLGAPQQVSISGPNLGLPSSWVFANYGNGTNQVWDDDGVAAALDLKYKVGGGFLTSVRAGLRYATQNDFYRNFSYSGKT
jgi:hypothetical protein